MHEYGNGSLKFQVHHLLLIRRAYLLGAHSHQSQNSIPTVKHWNVPNWGNTYWGREVVVESLERAKEAS
jgi:hypothetical protein